MQSLKPARRENLKDKVLAQLRVAILSGGIPIETRLVETDLAQQLQTSRGPVREALSVLLGEGLVEEREPTGTYIKVPNGKEMREIIDVRHLLERHASLLVVKNIEDEEINKLSKLLSKMKLAREKKEENQAIAFDLEFHSKLVQHANHTTLFELYNSLANKALIFATAASEAVNFERVSKLHFPIVVSLRKRDPDNLLLAIDNHYDEVMNIVAQMSRKSPEK